MLGSPFLDREYIVTQNDLFSRATFLCHRAEQALTCLQNAPEIENGCETIYEIGHCWTGVNAGQKLITSCPTIDPLKAAKSIYNTSRICFEAGEIQLHDGTTQYLPIGWEDIGDFFFPDIVNDCRLMDMMGYDGYDNTTDSSPQNGGLGESGWEVSFNLARDICMIVSFLSFIATFVSLLLMTFYLKKCTRIYIHMNLLTAFMLRTLMYIWAQFNIAYSKNGTESHYPYLNNLSRVLDNYEFDQLKKEHIPNITADLKNHCVEHFYNEKLLVLNCRMIPVLMNYVIICTNAWMCCEGLYLILLQSRPLMISASSSSKCSPLRIFALISWGMPAIFVGIWALMQINDPEAIATTCFNMEATYKQIIEIPIRILLGLSMVIFVVLLKDLVVKLRAPDHISGGGNFHLRMTKATVSLIPLLGIQTGFLPYINEKYGFSPTICNLVFPFNILLTASQGFIVSVLYCFTSHEVKQAVRRRWYMHWEVMRINREIISRRQSRDSQGGLLSNIHGRISFGRHSRSDAVLNRRDTVDTTAYLQPVIEQNENVQYWGEKDEQRHSNCSEDSGMPESGSQSGLGNYQNGSIPSEPSSTSNSEQILRQPSETQIRVTVEMPKTPILPNMESSDEDDDEPDDRLRID